MTKIAASLGAATVAGAVVGAVWVFESPTQYEQAAGLGVGILGGLVTALVFLAGLTAVT